MSLNLFAVRLSLLLFILITAPPLKAEESALPEKPVDFIVDQAGSLGNSEHQSLGRELRLASDGGLDVYVIILSGEPGQPPEDYAERVLDSWGGQTDRAAVVRVPGAPPAIALGGPLFDAFSTEQKDGITITALKEGAEKGRTSSGSMIEIARSLISQVQAVRNGATPVAVARDAGKRNKEMLRLALWLLAPVLILASVLIWWLRRRKSSALIFPEVDFRRRFSAPHSGGNNAMITFENSRQKE